MSQEITAVIVNNEIVEIRRDEEGRVNMNDLYSASQKGETKAPRIFLRSKRAKKLVESLNSTIVPVKSSAGRYSEGTYAHEDGKQA